MDTDDKSRKQRTEKTIKQQIASAQMRLNRLKTKERSLSKSAETRQKIILGAEVAKVIGCAVCDMDKELVLGILHIVHKISDEDAIKYKKLGKSFLLQMVGRQT